MRNQFNFYAMQRSGHHAVLYWFGNCLVRESYYCNCCFYTRDPLENFNNGESMHDSGKINIYDKSLNGKLISSENMIVSYENCHILPIKHITDIGPYKHDFEIKNIFNIFVIRDVFNNLASLYKSQIIDSKKGFIEFDFFSKKTIETWISLACFFIESDYPYKINYNSWNSDENYRRDIVDIFKDDLVGIEYNEKFLNKMSVYGSGSSFGKNNGFNDRYMDFIEDSEFLSIFKDYSDDIKYIIPKLFGTRFNDILSII